MEKNKQLQNIFEKLEIEERTESYLIDIYDTALKMGAEFCFPQKNREIIVSSMSILADDSRRHRLIIQQIKSHY